MTDHEPGLCKACFFFFQRGDLDGECRRRPPRIIGQVMHLVAEHEVKSGSQPDLYRLIRPATVDATLFPRVDPHDWCGEWRAASPQAHTAAP